MKSKNFFPLLSAFLLLSVPQGLAQQMDAPAPSSPENAAQTQPVSDQSSGQGQARAVQTLPVTLPYNVKAPEGVQMLMSQTLPQGVSYVMGSSRLNGQAVADPVYGPSGTLYWTLPAREDGLLSFQVTGQATVLSGLALPALHRLDVQEDGTTRYLPVSGTLVGADFVQAKAFKVPETVQENAGQIKLPAEGTVYRGRDKITVVVEGPLDSTPVPLVNGEPARAEQVGSTTTDKARGVQRLEYYGVPIKTGVNHITLGKDDVTVRLAGSASQVDIEPLQVVADGVTPIRLRLRTLDKLGLTTNDTSLTLRSDLEPLQPDASAGEGGYQVALQGGEGLLELRPQTTPTTLHLEVLAGNTVLSRQIEIRPDNHAVGVGMLSATLGLNSDQGSQFSVQARAYYEGPLAGGKLYLAADKGGLPNTTATLPTNDRFVNYGDSSVETVPLQGNDPVAFTYDHPRFRISYRQTALPLSVLPLTTQITALTAESKTNPALSGFVAWVPGGVINDEHITPSGTRLLRLSHTNLEWGSQVLTLVTLDRVSGAELSRTVLIEGADYSIDPTTGIVTLARALDHIDASLNTQYVSASYRVTQPNDDRHIAYGVQLAQRGAWGQGQYEVGAALASLGGTITYGAAAKYTDATLQADSSVLYSSGVLATVHLVSKQQNSSGAFGVRYQSDGYKGLGTGSSGFTASGRYDWQITPVFGARLEGEYGQQNTLLGSDGYVGLLGTYKLAPWTVGGGVRYGFGNSKNGFGLTGLAGYSQGPVVAEVSHTQPIGGSLDPTTEVKFGYRINQWVTLDLRDIYNWNTGNTGAVALNTTLGITNYIVAYETGNSSGQENRARFGVGTSLPLNSRTSVGLRAAYLRNLQSSTNEFTAGADLNYRADHYLATVGSDVSYRSDTGTVTVLHGGVTGDINDNLNLSADATAELGARQGLKLGLGYAYRAASFNSLGYLRYLDGSLANNNGNVSAGLAAEYRVPTFAVRAGVDARMLLDDHDTLTYQPYVGGNLYLADRFSVGAWGRALLQPATDTQIYGYGLEAGVKAIPGLWLTAGYNFKGFDGIPTAGLYTRKGAYLRLDLTLDETLNGVLK